MPANPRSDARAHVTIDPAILYFGTPVVLISTLNNDGSFNLAPMSSAWWLGKRCLLGLGRASKTTENLLRTGECVLNLPSADLVAAVNRLARTTGSNPVPAGKVARGYRFEPAKFAIAGLTPATATRVTAPLVRECAVQLEATVRAHHEVAADDEHSRGRLLAIETQIERVHVDEAILFEGEPNRIDPDKWRPLIMSFQQFYGLSAEKLHHSTLGLIAEALYR